MLSKWLQRLTSSVLIAAGIISVIIGALDFAGIEIAKVTTKSSASLTLVAVGILLLAVGLERAVTHVTILERLDRIGHQVDQLGGRYLTGSDAIYGAMGATARLTKQRIRGFIFGDGERSPDSVTEVLAGRLKELKDRGEPVKFDMVIAIDEQNPPPDLRQWVESRSDFYRNRDVFDRVDLRIIPINPTQSFDIYIVDNDHTLIAFSRLLRSSSMSRAILFAGQPQVASDFINWYDDIFNKATPYSEWISKANASNPDSNA